MAHTWQIRSIVPTFVTPVPRSIARSTPAPGQASKLILGINPRMTFVIAGRAGGDALVLKGETALSLADLRTAHEGWFKGWLG